MKDSLDFTASQRTKYETHTALFSAAPTEYLDKDPLRERELWARKIEVRGDLEKELQVSMFARAEEVSLRLTDANDPLFLFVWDLEEREYPLFKAEQQLRVDFGQFAAKLSQLLDLAAERREKSEGAVTFSIRLCKKDHNRLLLRVSESNDFKELDHISLLLAAASDERLKKHLAVRVRETRAELVSAQGLAEGLRLRLDSALNSKEEAHRALQQLEEERQLIEERRRKEFQLRLEEERAAAQAHRANLEMRMLESERLFSELRATFAAKSQEGEEAASAASRREKELKSKVRDLEAECQNFVQEIDKAKRSLRSMESQLAHAQADAENQQQVLMRAQNSSERMEVEMREAISSRDELRDRSLKLESELKEKTYLCEKLESKLKLSSCEINKANEIMESFEADLQKKSSKIKDSKIALNRLERENSELRLQSSSMAKQITEMAAAMEALKEREAAYVAKQSDLEARASELQKALEISQNSVTFLSQKISAQARPFMSDSASASHPWVSAANGLSATAQALLRRQADTAPLEHTVTTCTQKNYETTRYSAPVELLEKPITKPDAYFSRLTAPSVLTQNIAGMHPAFDEEEPRNPISQTILPVKFKGNF